MNVVILGGAGFVGLNIAQRLARAGARVTAVDRGPPPPAVRASFEAMLGRDAGRVAFATGDVTRPETITPHIPKGIDAVVYGAAVTADAARDAAEPGRILAVNLLGLVPALEAARAAGVRRVINLSSTSAVGAAADAASRIEETISPDPVSLYSVTKFASERVAARLGALWPLDIVSVRLSAVFGPLEYATGVRDTLSPIGQIMMAATRGAPALLARPGMRDWVYAPDVADAVAALLGAGTLAHRLYNITHDGAWSALAFGEALAVKRPGFECRLVRAGEAPSIDLFAPSDRAPLAPDRLRDELGWTARHGLAAACEDFDRWARDWGAPIWGGR